MKYIIIALFAVGFFSTDVEARKMQPWNFEMVAEESSIKFDATLNNASSKGEFEEFTADIQFHPKALKRSFVLVEVDMNKISSAYKDVADNLVKKEWFNAGYFPTARFAASSFSTTKDGKYVADGNLTIKGRRQPVKLEFELLEFTEEKAHMVGQATVKRMDYEIGEGEWANTRVLKNDVVVDVEIIANRQE